MFGCRMETEWLQIYVPPLGRGMRALIVLGLARYLTPVAEVKLNPAREDEVWVLTTWAAKVPGEDVVTSTTP